MIPGPERAPQVALAFVKTARDVYGRDMDFSLDSLGLVEEILDDLAQGEGGGSGFRLLLQAASCYVGEVIIRAGAGGWVAGARGEPLILREGGLSAVPYNKVMKRLEGGPEEALRPYALIFIERAEQERARAAALAAAQSRGLMARLRKWVRA
jgi:hypothetical protein